MYSIKTFKLLVAVILLTVSLPSYSQKVTFSPYSRYGIGDIYPQSLGHNADMGGAGIAHTSSMYLNLLNPSANTCLPMQRFIFDVGMDTKYTTLSSAETSQHNNNTTFKYLAAGFAAKPWWSFVFALRPYSAVGYSVDDTVKVVNESDNVPYYYRNNYTGSGGLTKISLGTSFMFFNTFSVSATGGFLFGSLDRYNEISMLGGDSYQCGVYYDNRYIINGFQYEFGATFSKAIKSSKDSTRNVCKFNLGATFGTDAKLNTRNELLLTRYDNFSSKYDTICNDTLTKGNITVPQKIGFGVAVEFNECFTVMADYTQQDWKNFDIAGENHTPLKKSTSFGVGIEYVKDRYSSRFFKTIQYRAGFHTENTYLQLNGVDIKNQGITFGLGLPLRTLLLNIGCDLGKKGTTDSNLYQEKYFLLHFNVTIHDVWFVKRKFQ